MLSFKSCLILFAIVFALSVGATQSAWSDEPDEHQYCLPGTKHPHHAIKGKDTDTLT